MSSEFGKTVTISLFGQSHGAAVGVVIDGLPAGFAIDFERIQTFMNRRAGGGPFATPRKEPDIPQILSGTVENITCGAPLCAIFPNTNCRSGDYRKLRDIPRPGHADYTAEVKYKGSQDPRGGGHFSARLTAPLCFAGAVCIQMLEKKGITIGARLYALGGIADAAADYAQLTPELVRQPGSKPFPVADDEAGRRMQERILQMKEAGDSVGGIVECCVLGVPAGLGGPWFGGIESQLAAAVFGIPAVKGVEFGAGFEAARLAGSENNDAFYLAQNGEIRTKTNRHGGILGGITSGMPLVMRAAFKPTPSIRKEQRTLNLADSKETDLKIEGRHDPCVAVRAVPCVEAVAAAVLLDIMLTEKGWQE